MGPGRRKPNRQAHGLDSKKTRVAPHFNGPSRGSATPGGEGPRIITTVMVNTH